MPMPTPALDVTIVGAGISGLSAARELVRAGMSVRVLERDARCGGVIRTDVVDGFVVEGGPDTLLAHKPAAVTLCRDLGLGGELVPPLSPPSTFVVRGGRLRALPATSVMGLPTEWRTLLTTRAFSWPAKVRMAAEPLVPAKPSGDESVASFVGRRFGQEAVTYLAEPLLAGLHRGDAARLSMPALFPTLVEAERTHGSVVRSWRQNHRLRVGRAGSMSLRGGLGDLVERLSGSLPPGTVVTGAEVRTIERGRDFAIRLADGTTTRSRAVILAAPAPAVSAIVAGVDGELARLCAGVRCASSVNVALAFPSAQVPDRLPGWGVVVPAHEGRRIGAVTCVSEKWPHRAPPGQVLLRASISRAWAEEAGATGDDEVCAWVTAELRTLLGIDAGPTLARVFRWPSAMPQLEVGHLDRMRAIDDRLAQAPGLFVSASGFRGVGIADCVGNAQATARRVLLHLHASAN